MEKTCPVLQIFNFLQYTDLQSLEKAKKPASYELARHTVFFLNILQTFFKECFGYFQMNILTDTILPNSL